jgi:enhancer of mRNA-decapping protein 3
LTKIFFEKLTTVAGEAALIDGAEILQVRTDHVVCIGAPRIGLLRALQKASATITSAPTAATDPLHWQLWVVDIGVNRAWKQSGMTSSKGIKFGGEWVVPLKLVDGPEDGRS